MRGLRCIANQIKQISSRSREIRNGPEIPEITPNVYQTMSRELISLLARNQLYDRERWRRVGKSIVVRAGLSRSHHTFAFWLRRTKTLRHNQLDVDSVGIA
jgi:hypothetical protein